MNSSDHKATSILKLASFALHTMGAPFIGMLMVCGITQFFLGDSYLFASMGATCVLFFSGDQKAHLPNLWITHSAGALTGFVCMSLIPTLPLAAATAIALMQLFMLKVKRSHAPAGATTLLIVLGTHAGLSAPQLFATLLLNLTAISIIATCFRQKKRPSYATVS